MPSTSRKQEKFMAAAANDADFAEKADIDQKTARDYHEADKRENRLASLKSKDYAK